MMVVWGFGDAGGWVKGLLLWGQGWNDKGYIGSLNWRGWGVGF